MTLSKREFLESIEESQTSKKQLVLDYLVSKGEDGATNSELAQIQNRFGASIKILRNEGHEIVTSLRKGYSKYFYKGWKEPKPMRKPVDVVVEKIFNHGSHGKEYAELFLSILEDNSYIVKGK